MNVSFIVLSIAVCSLLFYAALAYLFRPKSSFSHLATEERLTNRYVRNFMNLAKTKVRFSPLTVQQYEKLLIGCGWDVHPTIYLLYRQLSVVILPLSTAVIVLFVGFNSLLIGLCIGLTTLVLFDQPILRVIRKVRTNRMTREIYIVSNQLLYLESSNLHIHTKLIRCLPYTRVIRTDLQRLLSEWYHDAEAAIQRFKRKLGTEEGMSFAETISSLRMHDSAHYYELLQERIQDYKEKIDLAKESQKESSSYVLFVLAGIPIMYTFQVFIYPWVREGQQMLNMM